MTAYEAFIKEAVEKHKEKIIDASDQIFNFAEIGFREHRSAKLLSEMLEQEGFQVTRGIAGMPTAFMARYGTEKPVIGLLAEYDALPGLGQEGGIPERRVTQHCPDGHGCGHNLLGAGACGAALAVKEYLEKNPSKGSIILFGCPSEEKGNGKTLMSRDGIFDQVDAAFTWHPSDQNYVWTGSSLANISVYFDFKGVTAHAAASPHLGRSALDAAELMNVGVNYLREHIIPEARVHYAYLDVGGNAPNVVQGSSRVHYFIRAPKTPQVLDIFERIKDVAKGAALMTGTTSSFEVYSGLSDFVPNRELSQVLQDAMEAVGVPDFDAQDTSLAEKFFDTMHRDSKGGKGLPNSPLDRQIPAINWNMPPLPGSTDVGDVSHVVPTAQCSYATCVRGTAMHTWQATAQGNTGIAHEGVLAAGKAMAIAAVRVLEDENVRKQMVKDWEQDTGGQYICPISADVVPHLEDSY